MGPLPAFHQPVEHWIWIVTCAIWFAPEIALSRKLRSGKDAQKSDRGSMVVVIVSLYLGIYLAFLAANKLPNLMVLHWRRAFYLGIIVWYTGILLRWYAIWILGRFFTFDVAISKGQSVVEAGPYRWVRHPSYLGGLLAMFGMGITLTNWLAMCVPPFCLALGYLYRIPVEERALVQGLGSEYTDYKRRTWRLIPYVF